MRQAYYGVLFFNLLHHETVRPTCNGERPACTYEAASRHFVRSILQGTIFNGESLTSVASACESEI